MADPVVEAARFDWDEGRSRMAAAAPAGLARARRRVIEAVHLELRRRVGATFTLADLARAYRDAPDWYLDLAARTAPREPDAWDPAVALDAAFHAYARGATDARR